MEIHAPSFMDDLTTAQDEQMMDTIGECFVDVSLESADVQFVHGETTDLWSWPQIRKDESTYLCLSTISLSSQKSHIEKAGCQRFLRATAQAPGCESLDPTQLTASSDN
ncbi:hypothetical protein Ae201684P_016914 [Aphanomyces euteiches]|uniref:Uncharacterized protein n=1 Tax=Aphanomyces euteiches TaxID=100861 RepID=A0A6G0WMR3_9STRA|nr:hypothetical protein Ae201684_013577 [Aphanomyces euteiches]KAH9094304.1 hypothetical protein Ae201684P_016914 [Aphanomyces euteiches]